MCHGMIGGCNGIGCDAGQGPLVISLPPSSFAQVNFSVPVSSNASVINLLRPANGTIL